MSKQTTTKATTFAAVILSKDVTLAPETVAQVVSVIDADSKLRKRWLAAADTLRASGVTSEFMKSSTEARKAFMSGVVLLSFTRTEQAIMAKSSDACDEDEKVARRVIRQEMGAKYDSVIKYIVRAEKAETMTEEERGAQARASISTRLRKDLTAWVGRIEKAEAVDFPAVEMIKAIKSAIVLIK
jgi:hypothetical protein